MSENENEKEDEFNLIEIDFNDLPNFIEEPEGENPVEDENGKLIPNPIPYQNAVHEAKMMLHDFLNEKRSVVMNIFEYKDGFQVDVISNYDRFEIYDHLYEPEDVKAQVYWNFNKISEIKIKEMK